MRSIPFWKHNALVQTINCCVARYIWSGLVLSSCFLGWPVFAFFDVLFPYPAFLYLYDLPNFFERHPAVWNWSTINFLINFPKIFLCKSHFFQIPLPFRFANKSRGVRHASVSWENKENRQDFPLLVCSSVNPTVFSHGEKYTQHTSKGTLSKKL